MTTKRILIWAFALFLSSFNTSIARNIARGSILTAGSNSSWLSPSGDFAFGFYRLDGGQFLIGIWFDKIPLKTLVWSANRDSPAPVGSTVGLTQDGLLVATYPNRTSYPIYVGRGADYALMQDDGNLVLKDSLSSVLWQSFSSPTDTLLPGQVLVKGQKLFSNPIANITDYATGDYRLELQLDGNLVISAQRFADWGYWDAENLIPGNGSLMNQRNVSLVFNNSAIMYLTNGTNIIRLLTTTMSVPVDNYYHRATMDDYGNFQQFVYRRNGTQWTRVWRALEFPCKANAVCGVYGYCATPNNETVNCTCLPGFVPIEPEFPRKGCYPQVVSEQQCAQSRSSVNYTIQTLENSNIPNRDFAHLSTIQNTDLMTCRQAVLDDCYCTAAVFMDSFCYKKRMPLFNARSDMPTTNAMSVLIKVANTKNESRSDKSKNSERFRIAGLITSSVVALLFTAGAIYYNQAAREYRPKNTSKVPTVIDFNLREFTYKELYEATNGFSEKLGQGAFGTVYRGNLISDNKRIEIAVKKLEKVIERGEKEFTTELKVIGRTYHKNLVRLVGFCDKDNHRILVYELMKNGSLSGFLFKEENKPSWDLRVEIVLGIARGLVYLHEECDRPIIHCDVKPQNVLLDQNYAAKIADFGLAKLLMSGGTRTSTNVRGTMGYMAPEWLKNVPITSKVDVYSFGVMLLEIICCRRQIMVDQFDVDVDVDVDEETDVEEMVLTDWILTCLRLEKLETLMKHDEEVLSDFKRFERMIFVGLWCIHPDPVLRPAMKKVMQMLEGVVEVGVPPLVYAQAY